MFGNDSCIVAPLLAFAFGRPLTTQHMCAERWWSVPRLCVMVPLVQQFLKSVAPGTWYRGSGLSRFMGWFQFLFQFWGLCSLCLLRPHGFPINVEWKCIKRFKFHCHVWMGCRFVLVKRNSFTDGFVHAQFAFVI